jgi:hypothetical protein
MPVPKGYTLDASPTLPAGYTLDAPPASAQPAPEQPPLGASKTPPSMFQTMKDNFNAGTQHVPTAGLKSIIQNIGAGGGDTLRSIKHMVDGSPAAPPRTAMDIANEGGQTVHSFLGDPTAYLASQVGQAGTGLLLGEAGGRALAALPSVPKIAGQVIRKPFTGAIDEPIVNTTTTPRLRYQAAKRVGVNLDLSDATNSAIPRNVKAFGQDSLAGNGVYERAKVSNIGALNNAADQTLEGFSPYDRETGGVKLQEALKTNQEALKTASNEGHGEIQRKYGDMPVSDPRTLSDVGSYINKQNKVHYSQFPSLKPGRVASVVDDAANFGNTIMPTVGDALKARSGILDMYQNNPEIVKSAADAQLQQLVGATHDTVMDSLPASAQKTLRDAQLKFKEMKQVYDNPSSPYYDAVRTANPTSKVAGIGSQTPEAVRQLMSRAGDEGTGVVRRGVAEKMLGTAAGNDAYNFKTFPRQLSKLPADYAGELYKPEQLSRLKDISSTAQALEKDLNSSGTAKQGQKIAEAVGLIPSGGLPLLQYPLARIMNSPKLVDWMMRDAQEKVPATTLKRLPVPLVIPDRKNGTR